MKVTKMHGCGNDFCVITSSNIEDYSKLAISLCNRKTGVGADGLIVVKEKPLEMIFYNADGSRAPMCGNGIRCFAKYCFDQNIVKKHKFDVLTLAGKMAIQIQSVNPFTCSVEMGKPFFQNSMIYVSDSIDSFGRMIQIEDFNIMTYSFFIGTIHTVILVESLENEILQKAELISNHPLFKKKTNVNFVQVKDNENINIKTFERGVGWTLACGTGACASVIAANKLGLIDARTRVHLELGYLDIEVTNKNTVMTGPAVTVFECNYEGVNEIC